MESEQCLNCGENFTSSLSNTHTCNFSQKIDLTEEKTLKDKSKVKVIPIEIELELEKNVKWRTTSITPADLITGVYGTVVRQAIQRNKQKYHTYIIKFSNGTEWKLVGDSNRLQLDLITWSWRIREQKSQEDYVTFGIDFSQFQTEINVNQEFLDEKLGLNIPEVDSASESSHTIQLRIILTKFIGIEIIRYLNKKQSDKTTIQEVKSQFEILLKKNKSINDFKKKNSVYNIQIVPEWLILIGLIAMFGGCMANMMTVESAYNVNSNDPDYIESVRIRSGMGKTVRSGREIVKACIVMAKDRGMSSSEARRYCN